LIALFFLSPLSGGPLSSNSFHDFSGTWLFFGNSWAADVPTSFFEVMRQGFSIQEESLTIENLHFLRCPEANRYWPPWLLCKPIGSTPRTKKMLG
jgi:hypothetical protein